MSRQNENKGKPDWYYEKQGGNPDWMAEKNALAEKQGGNPDWMAEKNALAEKQGGNPDWMAEKNALAEKQGGYPVSNRTKKSANTTLWWFVGGGILAGLLLAIAIFLLVGSGRSGTLTPTAIAVVGVPTSGVNPVTNTATTARITTGVGTRSPYIPPTLSEVGADNTVIEDAVYRLGVEAYKEGKFEEAQKILESIKPDEKNYREANKMLFNVYFSLGKKLLAEAPDYNLEVARKVLDHFGKANILNPDNPDLKPYLDKAILYYVGRREIDQDLCGIALERFRLLYEKDRAYRDATQLYYTCLIRLAQTELAKTDSTRTEWNIALNYYNTARGLEGIGDKSAAESGYREANLRLNPPTPTSTPLPLPTPTPRPANPCVSGGSGSNFSPYRASGMGASNKPDQGKGNIGGSVVDRNGNGIAGASVRAFSGGYSFATTTGGNGSYQFGAILGRANWAVQVTFAPGKTLCFSAAGSVFVDGQAGNYAEVSFIESVP